MAVQEVYILRSTMTKAYEIRSTLTLNHVVESGMMRRVVLGAFNLVIRFHSFISR